MGTKTEDYLKILAEGGDAPTSCCMTNTQKLIAEAIDRINNLQPGGGPTVVQTLGTSTADVMSQNAVTSSLFKDPSTRNSIRIGTSDSYNTTGSISIGAQSEAPENYCIAIGYHAQGSSGGYPYKAVTIGVDSYTTGESTIAIGSSATANSDFSIAIGDNAYTGSGPEHSVALGDNSYVGHEETAGYVVSVGCDPGNSGRTAFTRRIINVTDPTNAQDAATKNYVDTIAGNIATILQTLNSGNGAQ